MQFDGEPDAIGVSVIAVPGVEKPAIAGDGEALVGQTHWHEDFFVKGQGVLLAELLHPADAVDLGVDLQEFVSGVDVAVRVRRRVPQVHLQLEWVRLTRNGHFASEVLWIDLD